MLRLAGYRLGCAYLPIPSRVGNEARVKKLILLWLERLYHHDIRARESLEWAEMNHKCDRTGHAWAGEGGRVDCDVGNGR